MISWHEPKRLANLRKHGVDFADLDSAFDGHMLTSEDRRPGYGELRLQSLALWRGRVVFMVWTPRVDNDAHLISCRYANRQETDDYIADR